MLHKYKYRRLVSLDRRLVSLDRRLVSLDRRLVSAVVRVPVYRAGGLGSIPGWTNTQGLKIIEEKVLPLF